MNAKKITQPFATVCVLGTVATLGRVIDQWTEDDAERVLGELLGAGAPDWIAEQAAEWFDGTRPSDVARRYNMPGRPEELLFLTWPDQRSEIIEDSDAYAVLAHADGGASVVIEIGVTAKDVARAFALVPQALVLSTTGLGTGEGQGDRYFHYVTA